MKKKITERVARHVAWRLLRVALKRLGVPPIWWPVMWLSRKILARQLRKRGLTETDLWNEMKQYLRKGTE